MDTTVDKDFLAEAATMRLEVKAVSGGQIESLVDEIYKATSREVARKASEMTK